MFDYFFPLEFKEAKVIEFMNLKQDSMSVREYALEFTKLSKYAPYIVADLRAPRTSLFWHIGFSGDGVQNCYAYEGDGYLSAHDSCREN